MSWKADSTAVTADKTAATADGYIPAGGYTLTVASGSFALTGSAVGLRAARLLAPAQGAFALTGAAVGLRADRRLPLTAGSYAAAAQGAGLRADRRLAAAAGLYVFTGFAVQLRAGRRLAWDAGLYALTGSPVGLVYVQSGGDLSLIARFAVGRAAGGPVKGRASGGSVRGRGPMGVRTNWEFDAGEHWVVDLTCCGPDQKTPLDMTGGQIVTRLALEGELVAEVTTDVVGAAADGLVRVVIAPGDQPELTPNQVLTYTSRAILADGTRSDQIFGAITVRPTEFGLS